MKVYLVKEYWRVDYGTFDAGGADEDMRLLAICATRDRAEQVVRASIERMMREEDSSWTYDEEENEWYEEGKHDDYEYHVIYIVPEEVLE